LKNILYTLAIGDAPYFSFTVPKILDYGRKCGFDSVECWSATDGVGYPSVAWHKLDIIRNFVYGTSADRLCFVDADITIHEAPNILEALGTGSWIKRDKYMETAGRDSYAGWVRAHYSVEAEPTPYFNTGVWILTREDALRFLEVARPPWVEGLYEQNQWNHWFDTSRITENFLPLPTKWNYFVPNQNEVRIANHTKPFFRHYCSREGKAILYDYIDSHEH